MYYSYFRIIRQDDQKKVKEEYSYGGNCFWRKRMRNNSFMENP